MVHKQYFPCENMKLWFTLSCTVLVLGLVRSEELSWPQPGSCEWLAGFSTACVHDKMSSFSPAGYGNELLVVRQEFEVKSSAGCTAMVYQMNYDSDGYLHNSHDNTCLVEETSNDLAKMKCTWYTGESFHAVTFAIKNGEAISAMGSVSVPEDGVGGAYKATCSSTLSLSIEHSTGNLRSNS